MTLRPTLRLMAGLAAASALAACSQGVKAPTDVGACWHMVALKGGKVRFNKVSSDMPNLESCGVRLEQLRTQFIRLGGTHTELAGAFQGRFLFVQREGVFSSQTLDGGSYLALGRGGDGKLVIPGRQAAPQ